ncbi:beta-lactamase family protein [Jackrogersella minutella]|nr:beta-lactamase family protein [Jackrogersella minutella]
MFTPMEFFHSDSFSSQVRHLMAQHHVPGLAIAIVQDDEIASAGYGYACLDPEKPCTADTLFDIASCSKSMTAASVGLLVEDNEKYPKVQWETTMSSLLPDDFVMPTTEATQGVTVEDILSHRTGMGCHDLSYMGPQAAQPDTARSVTRNLRNLDMVYPLRAKFLYNNMMFTVAAHLVEVKTQQSFTEFLEEHFFQPLGMDSTSLQPSSARAKGLGGRMARGYEWFKEDSAYRNFPPPDAPESQGAGFIVTSVNDYIKWVKALLRREGPVSETLYQGLVRLRSFQNPDGKRLRKFESPLMYAAGLDVSWYRGYTVIGHGGYIGGFGSHFFFLPEMNFGIVAMGNAGNANPVSNSVCRLLINAVLNVSKMDRPLKSKKSKKKTPDAVKSDLTIRTKARPSDHTRSTRKNESRRDDKSDNVSNNEEAKDQTTPRDAPKPKSKKPQQKPEKKPRPQTKPLSEYVGKYWNPGYHTLTVDIKDDKLFVDATDRTFGCTMTFEHVSDQRKYIAHISDVYEGGDYKATTQFVFDESGRAVRMGLDFESELKHLIWFEREKDT